MKKLTLFLALMMVFTVGFTMSNAIFMPTVAYADSTPNANLQEAFNSIENSSGGLINGETKDKIAKGGKDAQIITLSIVTSIMVSAMAFTALKFRGLGDNSQAKSVLKNCLIGEGLGVVFLASYLGFILFGVKNFNFFS